MRRRRVREDWWADADIDRAQIFVPAIMGAGLLVSGFTLVRDALHGRRRRGRTRATALEAAAVAGFVRTGEPPDTALAAGLRPRVHYVLLALVTGALAVYGARGATKNYAPARGGMFEGLAWMYAALLLVVAGMAAVAVLSTAAAVTWPSPPRWLRPLLASTPLGQVPEDGGRRGVLILGWAAVLSAVAATQFVFTTAGAPQLLAEIDDEISAPVDPVLPWAQLGTVPVAIVLSVVVGLVGLRCVTFALGQLTVVVAALVGTAVLADRLERAFPPDGAMAGLTGSLPSAPVLQATLFAGLLPLAVFVRTRRRGPALATLALTGTGAVVVAVEVVRARLTWPSDAVAGVLVGLALVLATWWALEQPRRHRRCSACPWEAPGDAAAGPGLLPVTPAEERALRRAARWLMAATVLVFLGLAVVEGLPVSPEGEAIGPALTRQLQLGLLGLAAIAGLVALRWHATGAALAALAGTVLAVFAATTYQPWVSLLVAAAFLLPAFLMWVAWQHRRSMRSVVVLAMTTALLLAGTFAGATATSDFFFGPLHPRSATLALPVDSVEWAWSGGVTARSAQVVAGLDRPGGTARLVVAPAAGGDVVRSAPAEPSDEGVVRLEVGGLEPGTRYRWTVEVDGVPDGSRGRGRLTTAPEGPASFTLAVASCARTGSSGAVFDAIRAVDPLLFLHTGDLHYANIERDDPAAFGDRYEDVVTAPAQAALYRSVPVDYVWDDHDYGPENADASSPARSAAREAYRTYVPHHALAEGPGGAIHRAFTLGRVRVVVTDTRSERTGSTMLGARQLAWLEEELVTASRTHALVLWVNPTPWIAPDSPGADTWGGHADERRRIADTLAAARVDDLVMVSGDAHMVAIDDGSGTGYSTGGGAGFPLLQAAALDSRGDVKGGPYSEGTFPGAGQFGTVTVTDDGGASVRVDLAGRTWTGEVLTSLTVTLPVPAA
ncbi:alkaline phosphatase D family protein [Blastococcus sp. SYSU D01042]